MRLLQKLNEAIDSEIKDIDEDETPFVYELAKTESGMNQIRKTITRKVLGRGIGIYDAIIELDNELNPNYID